MILRPIHFFKKALFLFVLFTFPCNSHAQKGKDPYQKKYEWRIRQEVLYGTYIPKDVNEALLILNKLTDEESKQKLRHMTEEEVTSKLFFSFGRWMTHNWGFYNGSRLTVNLNSMGIYQPEDMSRFLMILFHRSLTQKPLAIKELLQSFHEKEKKQKEEKLKKGTVIYEETRIRPQPSDDKNEGQ